MASKKPLIWLFSLLLDSQRLVGKFCEDNPLFSLHTTGDWQFLDDIIPKERRIRVLLIDADQFTLEDIRQILGHFQNARATRRFTGKIVLLSKEVAKRRALGPLYHSVYPGPKTVQKVLTTLLQP